MGADVHLHLSHSIAQCCFCLSDSLSWELKQVVYIRVICKELSIDNFRYILNNYARRIVTEEHNVGYQGAVRMSG